MLEFGEDIQLAMAILKARRATKNFDCLKFKSFQAIRTQLDFLQINNKDAELWVRLFLEKNMHLPRRTNMEPQKRIS